MAELRLAPAHIGDMTFRRFRIRERIANQTPLVDLSSRTVEMIYKGPKDTTFTSLASGSPQFEILDATDGVVRFKPANIFFSRAGDWKWYFRPSGSPRFTAPESEMIVIEIKEGKI